jgi:hypothetical protein
MPHANTEDQLVEQPAMGAAEFVMAKCLTNPQTIPANLNVSKIETCENIQTTQQRAKRRCFADS